MSETATRPTAEIERRRRKAALLKKTREQRAISVGPLEMRDTEDGSLTLVGIACRTGVEYDVGWYREIILPSALTRTLSEDPDVQLVVNHAAGGQLPLARTRSGTMTLAQVDEGLQVTASLDAEDPDVQGLVRKLRRGDVDGMSFAFQVTDDVWSDDLSLRTIRSLSLHRGDVSVVNQGANPLAYATVRSQQAIEALAARSRAEIFEALLELRAGKALSAATMDVLTQVLNLVAAADEAVDEAQPLLAELMGVPNPDDDTETDDASGDGEERASVQRQITDPADVRMAIRQVIREPGQDERRAEIIERAKALNVPGLIPDAWTSAGELAEDRAIAEQEKRETYGDTLTALQAVLEDMFEDSGFYWVWVQDFTDAEVIYCAGGDMFSAPYTLEPGGAVSIGEGTEVRPVTAYVPLDTGSETEVTEPRAVVIPDFTTRARQELDLLRLKDGRR